MRSFLEAIPKLSSSGINVRPNAVECQEMKQTEIPAFLAHLKIYNGFPVPFIQLWAASKPDFRAVNTEHCARCLRDKLCAICGRRLGEYCYFIGGPLSKKNRLFVDPAMHKQCAEFASSVCPFVSGQRQEYATRPVNKNVARTEEMASAVRPEVMYILKTRTGKFKPARVNGRQMIQAGRWLRTTEIS